MSRNAPGGGAETSCMLQISPPPPFPIPSLSSAPILRLLHLRCCLKPRGPVARPLWPGPHYRGAGRIGAPLGRHPCPRTQTTYPTRGGSSATRWHALEHIVALHMEGGKRGYGAGLWRRPSGCIPAYVCQPVRHRGVNGRGGRAVRSPRKVNPKPNWLMWTW